MSMTVENWVSRK